MLHHSPAVSAERAYVVLAPLHGEQEAQALLSHWYRIQDTDIRSEAAYTRATLKHDTLACVAQLQSALHRMNSTYVQHVYTF